MKREKVVNRLNHLLSRCETSTRILEYLPPDRETLRERLGFVAELEALVYTAGGRPKKLGFLAAMWHAIKLFFVGHSAQALSDERARSEQQLLRSYEGACEGEFPLSISLVLFRQHDAIKRLQIQPSRPRSTPGGLLAAKMQTAL